jgi:16S rRNA (guanine966-N2)-methyltransferase
MTRQTTHTRKSETAPPGRVRIVAGKWRGRFLPVLDLPDLRPTSERIRETLFNWLAQRIEGSRCLDLFAGTGVLGLEALSRGAAELVLVERSNDAIEALRKSVAVLDAKGAVVHAGDALAYLRRQEPEPMDIVFLDPPFADESLTEVCSLLDERSWLAPDASVYLERDARRIGPELPHGWTVRREKKAGNVRYSLLDVHRSTAGREGETGSATAGTIGEPD